MNWISAILVSIDVGRGAGTTGVAAITTPRYSGTQAKLFRVRPQSFGTYEQKVLDDRRLPFVRVIHKLQKYDEDVALKIQNICKKISVQMKDRAFKGQHSLSVSNFLTGLK